MSYCKAHTIDEATVCLQNNIYELFNKLVVNASKSQIMLVGSRKYVENKIIKVAIGNIELYGALVPKAILFLYNVSRTDMSDIPVFDWHTYV